MTARVQKARKQLVSGNRNYAAVACCGCTVTHPLRERAIKIVVNPWFDRVILLLILANSIIIAIDDPNEKKVWADHVDLAFLIIFTIELVLKVIAMGFVLRPYSYLRDPWNVVSILLYGFFAIIAKVHTVLYLTSYFFILA